MTIEIWSSNGYRSLVDDIDKDLRERNWFCSSSGYFRLSCGSGKKFLHKMIAKRMGLEIDGLTVDHIDNIRINNVRSNLRLANNHEQSWNTLKSKDNRSGYKGVGFHKIIKSGEQELQFLEKQYF